MTGNPPAGITVLTTTDNTYTVATGTSFTFEAGPTSELVVAVNGPLGSEDDVELAAFGNVEAVYVTGTVQVVTTPPAASRGLL